MTYHNINPGLAEMLGIGVDTILPKKAKAWKEILGKGRLTDEMRDVFVACGWLSSRRDSRLEAPGDDNEKPEQLSVDAPADAETPPKLRRGQTFSTPAERVDADLGDDPGKTSP